ncbi:MAG: hypothetical protein ABIY70_08620 [Capsulimonas sp.]|uniref:hypothetical protein n=1 Tax=Capsulimonas sp. TaxID=2494211 RepID=UPI003263AAE9
MEKQLYALQIPVSDYFSLLKALADPDRKVTVPESVAEVEFLDASTIFLNGKLELMVRVLAPMDWDCVLSIVETDRWRPVASSDTLAVDPNE